MGKPKRFPPRKKPYQDFPLTWNRSSGYWCKKINGRIWNAKPRGATWQEALDHYNRDRDYLFNGQNPADFNQDGYSIENLCKDFLQDRLTRVEEHKTLVRSTYQGYEIACNILKSFFKPERMVKSLTTEDFNRLRTHIVKLKNGTNASPTTINNRVRTIKAVFNYGIKAGKLEFDVKFGTQFKLVPKVQSRLYRNSKPSKLYQVNHLKQVLDSARNKPQMFAMIMMAINCGFGPVDIGNLRMRELDLDKRWHDSGRNKTGNVRRCRLWPETAKAIRLWLEFRDEKQAKRIANNSPVAECFQQNADLVFLTRNGRSWYSGESGVTPLSPQFKKLSPPASLTFNCLRHSFRTIASNSCDKEAVNYIMGHKSPGDVGENTYVQTISDKRLKKVSKIVRKHYKSALK